MSAQEILKRNKTKLIEVLCGDHKFILNKAQEKKLITSREYNNLKSINKENDEGHVVELVDKIMNKGEKTCQNFLELLQTDDIAETYPDLENINLNINQLLPKPVQATSSCFGDVVPKKLKKDDVYELKSQPVGLCLIINNENFHSFELKQRRGTNKDAEDLAEVFSWLGFRVLMCKDQTGLQMEQTLKLVASPLDEEKQLQLQELDVQEWCDGSWRHALLQPVRHGDAFVCCILSHGSLRKVCGVDSQALAIKDIRRYFVATEQSPLTGKPKVFLIQACQGQKIQEKVLLKDVEEDSEISVPGETDFLVAVSSVEDYKSFRDPISGSWFIQSVCKELTTHCPGGEDIVSILHRVNDTVGQKEDFIRQHGEKKQVKQAPEVRFTLRKKLVLSPCST